MREKRPLATITTLVASVLVIIGATFLMMYFVRYQSVAHDLALIGAFMFTAGVIALWWQWKK